MNQGMAPEKGATEGEGVEPLRVGAREQDREPADDRRDEPGDADEEEDDGVRDDVDEPQYDREAVSRRRFGAEVKGDGVGALAEGWMLVAQERCVGDGFAAPVEVVDDEVAQA